LIIAGIAKAIDVTPPDYSFPSCRKPLPALAEDLVQPVGDHERAAGTVVGPEIGEQ
jgi:hypothetical protein